MSFPQHERKPLRLEGFDYNAHGLYFVTMCTQNSKHWFGNVVDGKMKLNSFGKIVHDCWFDLPNHYSNCLLDAFVVMPNHVHGVVGIVGNGLQPFQNKTGLQPFRNETGLQPFQNIDEHEYRDEHKHEHKHEHEHRDGYKPSPTNKQHGLPEIIRGFKTFSSKTINTTNPPHRFQWQKSYYDHIIRNEQDLQRIREYIENNPFRWWLSRK